MVYLQMGQQFILLNFGLSFKNWINPDNNIFKQKLLLKKYNLSSSILINNIANFSLKDTKNTKHKNRMKKNLVKGNLRMKIGIKTMKIDIRKL
jgi:hypothetical protein